MERSIEYRIVWPNGEVVEGHKFSSRGEVLGHLDQMTRKLVSLGIPRQFLPGVQGRVIEQAASDWMTFDEAEKEFAKEPEPPQHRADMSQVVPVVPPSSIQLGRVKSKKYGIYDPCVICGVVFNQCPHTGLETEAFVNYAKTFL